MQEHEVVIPIRVKHKDLIKEKSYPNKKSLGVSPNRQNNWHNYDTWTL